VSRGRELRTKLIAPYMMYWCGTINEVLVAHPPRWVTLDCEPENFDAMPNNRIWGFTGLRFLSLPKALRYLQAFRTSTCERYMHHTSYN